MSADDQLERSVPNGGAGDRRSDARGVGLGCAGIAAGVIAIAVSCTMLGGGGTDAPSSFEAELMCETWVKEKLKAPSTAKFSGTTSTVTNVGDDGADAWTVTGSVDAENSFGAMLRSSWTCDIRVDGDMWRGNATLLD